MGNFELVSFAGAEELARAVAEAWLSKLERTPQNATPYCVALSGGRIAGRFFSAAAELANGRDFLFKSVQFFWGDERCVPPTDPQSNFALAWKLFLEPAKVPVGQVHRLRGELDPEMAAAQGQSELCRVASMNNGNEPVLDLVFLGMGEDGHIASLFPDEPEELMLSEALYRPVMAPKPPPRRITLGYGAIGAAREVWVLASGAGKEQALRDSLAVRGTTPLARVLRMRSHTKICTDIFPAAGGSARR